MIFVLMHWREKETHLIPPRNQILRQTVWRLMFTLFWLPERQVTSGAKVEAAAHCDQSVQMFLWPWIVHARCSTPQQARLTVLSGRKPGLKRGSSLLIKLWAPTAVKTSAPSGLCRARILSVGLDVKMFSSSDSNIFPPFSFSFSFPLQGGSSRVPQEKERVRQMSGKPRGCVGKPKQDPDWRAESTEGHLLPQSWVAAAVLWSRAGDGAVYRLLQQNVKKTKQNKTEKTLEQKLLRPSLFLCSLRPGLLWSVPGIFEQLELASFSLSFLSCGLCMWRLKCRTHYALLLLFVHRGAGRGLGGGKASQWEPAWRRGNRKRKYRCFLKMCRSSARDYDEKPPPSAGQPGAR